MSYYTGAKGLFRPLIKYSLPMLAAVFCVFAALVPHAIAAEQSAMVIDANTGTVLYNSAGDEQRYPASLTKMMTLYMTFELIEKGRLKYDDKISISAQAATQPPSKLDLDAGDTISVRNAVLSLVTKSANDIAVALAEHIGGSETNFARLMTRKAREIGMSKTTFRNASGLPNSDQVTTARDMLTLALRLQDEFPEHYKLFATERFSYAGSSYRNHNSLLRSYRGTDGIKTGYTRASGFNLVSSVHRGSKHIVAAVFGGKTSGQRNNRMRNILDRSFIKAANRRTRPRFEQPQLVAKPKAIERPVKSALAPSKAPPLPHPAPGESAASDQTTLAAASPAVASPSPAASAEASNAPAQATTDIEDRISIARVRRVGVAKHFAEHRAAARTARENAPQDEQGSSDADTNAGPSSISELIASTAHANPPQRVELGMQRNGAITPTPSRDAAIAVTQQADSEMMTDTTPDAAPGRTPSTLQHQLSRILSDHRPEMMDGAAPSARTQTASLSPSPRANSAPANTKPAKAAAPPASANGTHLIQIGAYNTADEAERQLQSIRSRARTVLASAEPVTEPVAQGQRRFFRARFTGFDSQGATNACQELRRQSIDCFVAKVQ